MAADPHDDCPLTFCLTIGRLRGVKRADIGKRRWISWAVSYALSSRGRYEDDNATDFTVEEKASDAMERVDHGWENGDMGINIKTANRARKEWAAWTAEVVVEVNRIRAAQGAA